MHRIRCSFLLQGLIVFDLTAVGLSLVFAGVPVDRLWAVRLSIGQWLLLVAFLLISHGVFRQSGMYRSHRLDSHQEVYVQIVKSVSVVALLAVAVQPRLSFLAAFWACMLAAIGGSRVLLHRCLNALRRQGHNLRNVLIVGAGSRGVRFASALDSRVELGYRILGFLDDSSPHGVPLLGSFDDLPRILRGGLVDEVAVALPIKTYYVAVARIVNLCEEQGVVVRVLGDLFAARLARIESEQFEDLSVLTLFTGRGSRFSLLVKRVVDVLVSASALVVLAPLLACLALAIKLDSTGPALYSQIRAGYNGRRFRMWKFRTMIADAENHQPELESRNEVTGAAFKIRSDPRVTRIGCWLRRSSLDELPQLFNVLKGDMSLVGPRPLPLRDVDRLSHDWQRRRFSVRPGLTCLWQSGGRHLLEFDEWMRLDLDYIDNWSLLLDLKILLRTLPAVWSGAGAS